MLVLLGGCEQEPWNDPYPKEDPKAKIFYSSFAERPKHLDPARSYTEPEWSIIAQIYEPPLQYHYLKRPYVLEPLSAAALPELQYFDAAGKPLAADAEHSQIAYTDYIIRIKKNIFYQRHPAFAKDRQERYRYHQLSPQETKQYRILSDFKEQGTRELSSEDYVYQLKRLAEPHLASPIFGFMSAYIVGLKDLRQTLLQKADAQHKTGVEVDLRPYDLAGAEVIDRYTYRIRIHGKYPQFQYWLAMPFFAPVPWEVAQFYAQPGLESHNISLDWYPVGTGPFCLLENNPDRRMVLIKNTEFREELYPNEGSVADRATGLLRLAGTRLPLVDKVILTLEKEEIPRWNKFLQGYYDNSGISSDNFGSAIQVIPSGGLDLSEKLKAQGVQLQSSVAPGIWFWGFNMLDETLGGYSDKARQLRQAISLAFNVEEFISIFLNGRGILAAGPIPVDIFGFKTQAKPQSTNLQRARQLLAAAGYPRGVGLKIYFDTVVTGNPDEIAVQAWLQEQFEKLGIQLVIRGSDYNRFQEKLRLGSVQMFFSGWNADYPDPENFLFLFYGSNSSARRGGENIVNYQNPVYDQLFEKMRAMDDTPERLQIIQAMIDILHRDTPWIWGFYPKSFALRHGWLSVGKPSGIANNTLKYMQVDPQLRLKKRMLWNQPLLWPLAAVLVLGCAIFGPLLIQFWRKQQRPMER